MKRIAVWTVSIAIVVAFLGMVGSCMWWNDSLADFESSRRLATFEDSDWRALAEKVVKICADHPEGTSVEVFDGTRRSVEGDPIPDELRYLEPKRVWFSATAAKIELWHTPAGDNTIYVERQDSGVWTVSTHIGSWRERAQIVWQSEEEPNQSSQPTPPERRG